MKVSQLLLLQGPWWHQLCRDRDCLCHRTFGPTRVFFLVSCSWRSEGFFDLSFSMALPIQALRRLPCLGSLSFVWCIRHIVGPSLAGALLCRSVRQAFKVSPWAGSYSVGHCISCLMGQPLCCSAANAGMWGESSMVLALPLTHDSAESPCFHGCLAFLHRHFPPQSPPSHPLDPSLHS